MGRDSSDSLGIDCFMLTALRKLRRRVLRYSFAVAIAAGVYVGGFVNTYAATGWGIVSDDTAQKLDMTLYAPMCWYTASALPGGRELQHAREWWHWVSQTVHR
jgi:hypothetical protein